MVEVLESLLKILKDICDGSISETQIMHPESYGKPKIVSLSIIFIMRYFSNIREALGLCR